MDSVQDIFGKKIKSIRRARDITQEKLADLSGLSLQYIGEIERGRRNPSLTSIEQLSRALDLPMSELFSLEEFRLSPDELKAILIRQIESADEDRLRTFFNIAQTIFR